MNPSIFSKVHNRGIPPVNFIETLVSVIRSLPDEVFSIEYRSTKESDIYAFLVQSLDPDHNCGWTAEILSVDNSYHTRRAIMCEVLRVLGGFESSWRWNEGRDTTNPSRNKPETTEAGIFQCSANSVNFDKSLVDCFNRFVIAATWQDMSKSGGKFQEITKASPEYAIEHCARLLRFTIRHHGPIVRGEILPWISLDAVHEFDTLLLSTPTTAPDKPMTTASAASLRKYLIDPGHGGHDSGAVGALNEFPHSEKDLVFKVSHDLAALLSADGRFEVETTRSTDAFVTLTDRAGHANRIGATLVSIHANAGGGTGFECFTSPGQTLSDELATALLNAYGEEFADFKLRSDMKDGDPDKEARFTVLTATRGPAVLFELGFMDRVEDLRRMTAPDFVERAARALYRGILDYEGLTEELIGTNPGPVGPTGVLEEPGIPTPPTAFDRGYAEAIEDLDILARDNEKWRTMSLDDPKFWGTQRDYITGVLGAKYLREQL